MLGKLKSFVGKDLGDMARQYNEWQLTVGQDVEMVGHDFQHLRNTTKNGQHDDRYILLVFYVDDKTNARMNESALLAAD